MIVPIVSLDKIYFKGSENSYFLDCTRLNGVTKLVSRKNPNDITNVEKQIYDISQKLKMQKKSKIILVDDVVFSGSVLRKIQEKFLKNEIEIVGIRSAISTKKSYDFFNQRLKFGLKCGCVLGENVIDQVCERDFYFGIAQSGISILKNGKVLKSPYFKPFGNPVERASIPKEYEILFSNGCLARSMFLWKFIEDNSKRKVFIKDLPEKIVNTNDSDRILKVLEKGFEFYEKNTNRNNGERS